jgi:hypothetical protein
MTTTTTTIMITTMTRIRTKIRARADDAGVRVDCKEPGREPGAPSGA